MKAFPLESARTRRFIALFVLCTAGILAQSPQLPPGGDFTLNSREGRISLSDFRGKVTLLYFGYTSCPSVCPLSLSVISSALGQLSESERRRVSVVFISVDPERDSAAAMGNYASSFGPEFRGATGSLAEIRKVAHQYRVYFHRAESDSAMGYSVDHSAITYVVGKDGKLSRLLKHKTPASEIADAIRAELRKD